MRWGPTICAGSGGPMHVSPHPYHNEMSDALIDAGVAMGLERRDDINRLDIEGVGYVNRTIKNGKRVTAASAFLDPVRHRSNLAYPDEDTGRKGAVRGHDGQRHRVPDSRRVR